MSRRYAKEHLRKPTIFGSEVTFSGITLVVGAAEPKEAGILKGVLASLGSERIISASDPDILLGVIQRDEVDIVVVDCNLRGSRAAPVIKSLRRQPEGVRCIPVVMTGSKAEPEVIKEARDAGVDEFVTKPFTAGSLLNAIHSVVQLLRPFVISRDYCGPDRRGSISFSKLLAKESYQGERRKHVPSLAHREGLFSLDPLMPVMVPPSYAIRSKLGLEIPPDDQEMPTKNAEIEITDVKEEIRAASVQAIHEIVYYLRIAMHSFDRREMCVSRIKVLCGELVRHGNALGIGGMQKITSIILDGAEGLRMMHGEELASVIERTCFAISLLLKTGPDATESTLATMAVLEEALGAELRTTLQANTSS